ncbi:MAG TPA: fumarylacetoacetate hydrolase family protein [Flavobacteriaceae bacterium]|nr:fumarylacetoacetate hydrolase family protein [Flavobacteriaceae bacterium]
MKKTISEIASILQQAEKSNISCPPIRRFFEGKDLEKAYRVQEFIRKEKLADGQKIVGKKIGLTSKKVQEQLGVNEPDFGVLLHEMQISNNGKIPFSDLMQPKAEAEIAFVLKKDLTQKNISIEEMKNAIDYAVAAIEIVGSRIENWDIQITDTIADNASASHFVLGEKQVPLENLDLENCQMQMHINGEKVSEGTGKACLGNPLHAAVWLADKMVEMGNPLKKGEIILSGALGPMANLKSGDQVEAEIDGLGKVLFEVV